MNHSLNTHINKRRSFLWLTTLTPVTTDITGSMGKYISIQMSMSWSILPRSRKYSRIQSNMQALRSESALCCSLKKVEVQVSSNLTVVQRSPTGPSQWTTIALVRGMHHSLNIHINQRHAFLWLSTRDLWPGQQRAKGTISSNAESCTLQVIPVLLDKLNNCQELTTGHITLPFRPGQRPTCKHNGLFHPVLKLIILPQFDGLMCRWLIQTFPPWSGRPGLDISKPFRLSKANWHCSV